MRKILLSVLLGLIVLSPMTAQSAKAVKKAKKDTKVEVKYLKSEGFKPLDNVKLEDAVNSYLTSKYSTKSSFEAIGKAQGKDLNEARVLARADALKDYPEEDIVDSFFVYKKTRGRFEVICYAVLKGVSAKDASRDRVQSRRRSESTESTIESIRADQKKKEAKEKEERAREKAKKDARQKAKKEARKNAGKD